MEVVRLGEVMHEYNGGYKLSDASSVFVVELTVFYSQERWATTAVATIFVLAAITDWLDGYLARKMGSSSEFGAFLDPVADKLMVATTLVLLCTRPPAMAWARVAPWLLPLPAIAIIGREITMSAVREWAASQGEEMHKAVAVNKLGKWKTMSQMVALTLLLANRNGGYGIPSFISYTLCLFPWYTFSQLGQKPVVLDRLSK
jgi:CDP-diacylglycerol--glycerol-3-phosphate 3-phosphatidyltransferase